MTDLKKDTSTVLMIINHKQKMEPMKYRESQIEYYGKKGMSLLGMMMIRWNIADDKIGYEYSFHDYVVKGYISQDHVHVGAIIQLASRIINDNGLEIQHIIIQSDNASGFSSINLIPFICNMNSYNKEKKLQA